MPRILSVAGGLVGAAAIAAFVAAPGAHAEQALNGSAFGVTVDVSLGDKQVASVPPLPEVVYEPGGKKSVIELDSTQIVDKSHGIVSAKVLNAGTGVSDGVLGSKASVAELELALQSPNGLQKLKGALALTAELVTAECTAGPDGVTADSKLVDVQLAGFGLVDKQLVGAAGKGKVDNLAPNTTVELPGLGKVVLNEQIKADNGVTVNAIHVYLDPALKLLYGDIIVSQAKCFVGAAADPEPSESASEPGDNPSEPGDDNPEVPAEPSESSTEGAGGGGGGNGSGDLPVTGGKLALVAGLGAGLLVAGGAAIWFTRRRKAETAEVEAS